MSFLIEHRINFFFTGVNQDNLLRAGFGILLPAGVKYLPVKKITDF